MKVSAYSSTVGKGKSGGGQGQIEDRLIRRVDLPVSREAWACPGAAAGGLGNGGLDVLGRGIDVPVQGELQGDLVIPRALVEVMESSAGDGGKLLLQRGGHGRGHGLRAGPGQIGGHQDGGKIDIGQIAHRQEPISP